MQQIVCQTRGIIGVTGLCMLAVIMAVGCASHQPVENPAAAYGLNWVDELPWSRTVMIRDFPGENWDERLEHAQDALGTAGGVIYFPPGKYEFAHDIVLRDGIILRGAGPSGQADARQDDYKLRTRFHFPVFEMSFEGDGAPKDSSFRVIRLANPATDSNVGLVHIDIDHATIVFSDAEEFRAGRNRFVIGCVLTRAVMVHPGVPNAEIGQHPWQRYTVRHHGAINVYAEENVLIANNRLPKSEGSFRMPGYVVRSRQGPVEFPVLFDYNNRSGIRVNVYTIGGAGTRDPHGTPETHPQGFRKGIVIRENYIYHTGRGAIAFSADGAQVLNNVSRMEPRFQRFTHTGTDQSYGSSTNGNRAMMMRGWNNHIEGNEYTTYQNIAADGVYPINCGEGLMHEGHANSTIRNLTLRNNRGNAYLSLYMTAGIDGLVIEGNDIRTHGGISAIYVRSDRTWDRHPVRNVRIVDNITGGSGITISGEPAENNLIRGNRHVDDQPGRMIVMAEDVVIEDNHNYVIEKRELRLRP